MKLLLIDLSSIAHPIWHMSDGDSNPNATSIKTLERVRALASGMPNAAVCCDSGRSFRRDIAPDYKGQRPAADARLMHQIALVKDALQQEGFPVWSAAGFEADDLIATAVAQAKADGSPVDSVLIASADKDLLQLLGPRISVKRLGDGSVWDEATLLEKFGIRPDQMVDWLALVGDASDNIKGADKIGAKTAAELLKKYGNLEDLFADLKAHGTNFTPARATSLREFEARAEQVRSLIRLRTDVPLPFDEILRDRVPADGGVIFTDEESMSESLPDEPEQPSYDELAGPKPEAPTPAQEAPAPPAAHSEPPPPVPPAPAQPPNGGQMAPAPKAPESMALSVPSPSSRAVATVGFERELEPRTMRDVAWMAEQLFKAKLFSGYGNAQAVLSTLLAGRELGMTAMASLRGFHIIDSKPTLAADLIRAMILRSEQCEYFRCTRRDAEGATFVTKRKGDAEIALTFTIEEGRQAFAGDDAAWKKSGWGRNPADLCVARAGSKLARLVYPDVVHGFYAPEEMIDNGN